MLEKIQKHIERNKLFEKTDRILLAVSGGIDSMVMLHAFQALQVSIGVAHCNFQLRDKESDQDEEFVKAICQQAQVPFFSACFDTNNYAISHGLSIQMAARELRYHWFEELLEKEGYHWLATAHHLNDAIETSILNLVRGTGYKGVSGIAVKNGKRVRPLLTVSRKEIETYAAYNAITWREDASNQTNHYQRNVVRHEIVPRMQELNSSLEISFANYSERMKGANELVQLGIQAWKEKFWSERPNDHEIRIQKRGIFELRYPAPVVYEMVKHYGFNLEQCFELIETCKGQSGKVFRSESFQLLVDRDDLILTPEAVSMPDILIDSAPCEIQHHNFSMVLTIAEESKIDSNPLTACLDADVIQWPLTWRSWRPGDSFHPLGMQHKKKISDFLVDQKIPLSEKSRITVLESAGEIMWVVGYRIDDRFKVSPTSKRTLHIHVKSAF